MAELPISAVDVDTFELGRIAAETLFRQMEKPDFGASRSQITTKVIERGSTMKKIKREALPLNLAAIRFRNTEDHIYPPRQKRTDRLTERRAG